MSSQLRVFAVDVERLRKVVGSNDSRLIAEVERENDSLFAEVDELAEENNSEGFDPIDLTCSQALSNLVTGGRTLEPPGYIYGYVPMALVAHLGDELPSIDSIAGASDWIEKIDEHARTAGLPIKLSELVFGQMPVEIPIPDGSPCIGIWPAQQISPALVAAQAMSIAELETCDAETLSQMKGWLEVAVKKPGTSIVAFLL